MAIEPGAGPMRVVPTGATRIVAICGKCGKKIGGGFGAEGKRPLGKALRRAAAIFRGKRASVRIVETKCLDICPKGAVAVLDSARPDAVVIIAKGTSIDTVCAGLGLSATL